MTALRISHRAGEVSLRGQTGCEVLCFTMKTSKQLDRLRGRERYRGHLMLNVVRRTLLRERV